MPRPAGWKPLNYRTIACICGKLCLGQRRNDVAREMGVPIATVAHLRIILIEIGAVRALPLGRHPTECVDRNNEIDRLVRTTNLSNWQIMRKLDLQWTGKVRQLRKAYHDELRARGEPVPLCRCGDEYQHTQKCPFKGINPKPLDPRDKADAIKALQAGIPIKDLQTRFCISNPVAVDLLHALTAQQSRKRHASVAARRSATKRRQARRLDADQLYARLDAAIPKTIAAEVRPDVLQEMCVAVLSGEIVEKQAISRYRSFCTRAYQSNGDWRTSSINAGRDGLSLIDVLEDERALDEFSALDEMELG